MPNSVKFVWIRGNINVHLTQKEWLKNAKKWRRYEGNNVEEDGWHHTNLDKIDFWWWKSISDINDWQEQPHDVMKIRGRDMMSCRSGTRSWHHADQGQEHDINRISMVMTRSRKYFPGHREISQGLDRIFWSWPFPMTTVTAGNFPGFF